MFGQRTLWKTGLVAAGLLLTSGVALGGPLGLALRGLPPFGGVRYYYPGYYVRPFGYSVYGPGYGFSIRYGYGVYGMQMGYGLGYGGVVPGYAGTGYGVYGLPPGVGYGAALYPPANPVLPQQGQPRAMPPATPPRQERQGQIPQPTPIPPEEDEKEPAKEDNTARVTVVVPQNAELWFNGAKTTQIGKRREFVTAPLTPGKDFRYRIKARWVEDGKPVELTQTIRVRANSIQTVDFTEVPKAPAPE